MGLVPHSPLLVCGTSPGASIIDVWDISSFSVGVGGGQAPDQAPVGRRRVPRSELNAKMAARKVVAQPQAQPQLQPEGCTTSLRSSR